MRFWFHRYRKSLRGLPARVWYLAFVMLVNRSGAMVLVFLAIYLTEKLGWSEASAGQAVACYGVGACLGGFLGGRLTVRFGAYWVQLASLLGGAVGLLCLSQAQQPAAVLGWLLGTSVMAEMLRPANAAAIAAASDAADYNRAFALNRLAINLGFTAGPAVGGLLAKYSYTALFVVDALTCVLAACVLIRFCRPTQRDSISSGTGKSHLRDDTSPGSKRESADVTLPSSTAQFLAFATMTAIVFVVFFQLLSTYPLYLKGVYGLSELQIGSLMAINTLLIVAFEMVIVDLLSKHSAIRNVAWGALLICCGFALLPFGSGYAWAVLVVTVWTAGEMISMPAIFTHIASSSTETQRAGRFGIYSSVTSSSFVMAPLLGTYCYSIHPSLIWGLSGLVGPIAFIVYRKMDRRRPLDVSFSEAAEDAAVAALQPVEPGV
ncbi:MAG: MFS transporter [Planctomycetota bacterium]